MSRDHYAYPTQYPHAPRAYGPHDGHMPHGGYAEGHYPMAPEYGVYHEPSHAYAATQPYAYPGPRGAYSRTSSTDRFLKGLLIGAAVTYLVTNESVQRTAIKGAVKAWSMLHGGVEEMKERFRDAEAELHTAEAEKAEAEKKE